MSHRGWTDRAKRTYVRVREWRGEETLRELFQAYYSLDPPFILPKDMMRREFAFQPFGSESYVRHLSFKDEASLRTYIKSRTPKHAYHSVAIYELPEAPTMEEKGWLGSDLLFDIDLDHPGLCSSPVIDDSCLVAGFKMAQRVVKVVRDLLGGRAMVYFTGHRGFHIRGKCEECFTLGKEERREIAKLVRGEGLDLSLVFPLGGKARPAPPTPEDPGVRGLLAAELGAGGQRLSLDELREAASRAFVDIDSMVTEDPTRLTRIPGTLNVKGPLIVTPLCDSFAPGPWMSPFRGELEARALKGLDQTRIIGYSVGFREGEELALPAPIALYLWSSGIVELRGGEIDVVGNPGWWPVQGCDWEP
ncbi:MAG: DNA primase small subunit domain-containing protein [Acidilobus sp.]